ncbi:hypothetical protein HH212_22835 [Massilia forsythiae]|uniref:Uncharacterized protein n=1 Tax=Massilia forsythiae TaxID=2728020 RepID=A0A7Z2W0H8_9BURK|nr:hypothetical protein [Massilia forsythiae]QJE02504.1 hypothetical protein HH212_22835 [Massilia forsythiae]
MHDVLQRSNRGLRQIAQSQIDSTLEEIEDRSVYAKSHMNFLPESQIDNGIFLKLRNARHIGRRSTEMPEHYWPLTATALSLQAILSRASRLARSSALSAA